MIRRTNSNDDGGRTTFLHNTGFYFLEISFGILFVFFENFPYFCGFWRNIDFNPQNNPISHFFSNIIGELFAPNSNPIKCHIKAQKDCTKYFDIPNDIQDGIQLFLRFFDTCALESNSWTDIVSHTFENRTFIPDFRSQTSQLSQILHEKYDDNNFIVPKSLLLLHVNANVVPTREFVVFPVVFELFGRIIEMNGHFSLIFKKTGTTDVWLKYIFNTGTVVESHTAQTCAIRGTCLLLYVSDSSGVENIRPGLVPSSYASSNSDVSNFNGLTNFGNSCYMNAALQALIYVTQLRTVILRTTVNLPTECLNVFQLVQQCFTAMMHQQNGAVTPSGMYTLEVLRFLHSKLNIDSQQDSMEFLVGLLNRLQEAEEISNGRSLLRSMLYGVKCFTRKCNNPECSNSSAVNNFFTHLSLPISHGSVFGSFKSMFKSTQIDWRCQDECFVKDKDLHKTVPRQATEQVSITTFPPVLVVALNRFRSNRTKINKKIIVNEELDLSQFSGNDNNSQKYGERCELSMHMIMYL